MTKFKFPSAYTILFVLIALVALGADAPEATTGFLLNHLISELLPDRDGVRLSNSDPVTGQAAWFDLRVSITRAEAGEGSLPQFPATDAGKPDPTPLRYGASFRKP